MFYLLLRWNTKHIPLVVCLLRTLIRCTSFWQNVTYGIIIGWYVFKKIDKIYNNTSDTSTLYHVCCLHFRNEEQMRERMIRHIAHIKNGRHQQLSNSLGIYLHYSDLLQIYITYTIYAYGIPYHLYMLYVRCNTPIWDRNRICSHLPWEKKELFILVQYQCGASTCISMCLMLQFSHNQLFFCLISIPLSLFLFTCV